MIPWLFSSLFFITPLVMYFYTSELFEFNKIITLYLFTVVIIAVWLVRMIREKRVIFRRTIMDIPLLIFLGAMGISTIFSIDFHTSLLGYYTRFNGGLVSTLCYALLYWVFVSNMDKQKTLLSIRTLLFVSVPVCLYGIAQHFGIDKDIWVQDVQNRIFSTLGQPNWLAAWIVAIMPLTWATSLSLRGGTTKQSLIIKYSSILLSLILFLTLLYTKSRSGLLAFGIEFILFWSIIIFKKWELEVRKWKTLLVHSVIFFVLCALIGTPWSPSLIEKLQQSNPHSESGITTGTVLESGGTESGEIRKIVWKGAFDIWKAYPIFGTGVETFAFAYYQFKPGEHNYTSEWDYLYNKAHNEYLNYLATTGTVGFAAYLVLIGFIFYQFKIQNEELHFALLAGFASILITNFFGFSVVPVSLLFFLFPAMAITLHVDTQKNSEHSWKTVSTTQKVAIMFVVCGMFYLIFGIVKYWYADTLYAKGKMLNAGKDFVGAQKVLILGTEYSPQEAVFWNELAESDRNIAVILSESSKNEEAAKFAEHAIKESIYAVDLSPSNVNLKRNLAVTFTKLALVDPEYLSRAHSVLLQAVEIAPTDPKLQYSLAASYYRLGELDKAIEEMQKAVEMKTDYKDSRFALAMMYIDAKKLDDAKKELEYILEKIDARDEQVRKELEELKD
jgi:O-antigen ligase